MLSRLDMSGRAFAFFMRPGGRSRRIRLVLSIEGACLSCKRAIPIPAICRGRCVRERLVLRLRRALTACGWSLRECRRVVLGAAFGQSSPFSRYYLMVSSSVVLHLLSIEAMGWAHRARSYDAPYSSHRSSRCPCTCVYVQTRARDGTGRSCGTITHGHSSPVVRARQRPRLTWTARPASACSRRCR